MENNSERCRNYYQLHRKESKLRSKRYRESNREKLRTYSREYSKRAEVRAKRKLYEISIRPLRNQKNRELRKEALEKVGNNCKLCNISEPICFHEVSGKIHPNRLSYILENSDDFVPLCLIHHRLVHEFSKLSDEQLETFFFLVRTLKHSD